VDRMKPTTVSLGGAHPAWVDGIAAWLELCAIAASALWSNKCRAFGPGSWASTLAFMI